MYKFEKYFNILGSNILLFSLLYKTNEINFTNFVYNKAKFF